MLSCVVITNTFDKRAVGSHFVVMVAVGLLEFVLYRMFLPHRAYRIFLCMHPVGYVLGAHFRSNNYLESFHRALKFDELP